MTYEGILPDSMKTGRNLVVEGVLGPQNKSIPAQAETHVHFNASKILTKCPSKYEEEANAKENK